MVKSINTMLVHTLMLAHIYKGYIKQMIEELIVKHMWSAILFQLYL